MRDGYPVGLPPVHERLVGIQLLRFFAALAVAASHAQIFSYWIARTRGLHVEQPSFPGGAGVDVFFVISGFIMVYTMRSRVGNAGARRAFLKRRIIRIVPLYWLVTTGLAVWGWRYGPSFDFPTLVTSFFFIPYPSYAASGRIVPYLEPGWTLNFEMLFYLLFAGAMTSGAGGTVKRCSFAIAVLVLVGSMWTMHEPALLFWTSPISLEFCAGMLIALAHPRVTLGAPVRTALAMAAVGALYYGPPIAVLGLQSLQRTVAYGIPAIAIVIAVALGPMKIPMRRLAQAAGEMSYSLYLIHLPIMIVVRRVTLHFHLSIDSLTWIFSVLALSTFCGGASWMVFERPMTSWLGRRWCAQRTASELNDPMNAMEGRRPKPRLANSAHKIASRKASPDTERYEA